MKPSSFDVIKSHVQYGHNVFAKNEKTGECRRFWHVKYDSDGSTCLISDDPHLWTESAVNRFGFTSITPIPHRYKKLEVGTKVDVLKEYNQSLSEKSGWQVFSYESDDGFETVRLHIPGTYQGVDVPLWAITPHVEGEEVAEAPSIVFVNPLETTLTINLDNLLKDKQFVIGGKTYKVLITEQI